MLYTYSIEDHLLTAGSDTYQFDPDGFLTQKTTSEGTTTYRYSSRGELLEVTLPDGTVISYDYDPLGRRIAKKVNGQVVEKYLWSGRIRLLAVFDGNDNLIMRFNYADDRVPYSMEYLGQTYYLMYDQIGSLRAVVDSSGLLVKRIDYDSFGNIILDTDPSFKIPIGFAGGLYDADTGLVRFGVRDYDPTIGRWTAKDPIDFAGGSVNLYEYVQNDPVNWVDPSGLFIKKWIKKFLKKQIEKIPVKIIRKFLKKVLDTPTTPQDIITDPTEVANPEGDSDGDGIPDYLDDSDGDGINDFEDPDDDNDGIPDDEDDYDDNQRGVCGR